MAYIVSNNCENKTVKKFIDALLKITSTESYPNGNNGYNQSEIHRHAGNLAPYGVRLGKKYSGDAYTMGSYFFVCDKHFSCKEMRAIRTYVLNEIIDTIGVKRGWQYKINELLRTDLFSKHVSFNKKDLHSPITLKKTGFIFYFDSEKIKEDKSLQHAIKDAIKACD